MSPEKVDVQRYHAAQLTARSNAMAETINGLYKAEVIHRKPSWRSREEVEWATLAWVQWFNNHRLLEPIGDIPPAEAEANFWLQQQGQAITATGLRAVSAAAV